MIKLDERLSTAASFYTSCNCGADIGTDHGLLPCYLLQNNICKQMILIDISPQALSHAKANLSFFHLNGKAEAFCADGLSALCGRDVQCISITGMGGKLIAEILTKGKEYLNDATLVLSAHTDLPIVRRTLQELHYHIVCEHVCRSADRFYIIWKAEAGQEKALTDEQMLFGTEHLTFENEAVKEAYIQKNIKVLEKQLSGLNSAKNPELLRIEQTKQKIAKLKERFVL